MPRRLVVSSGEPAGIGPDLCLQLAQCEQPLVVIADKNVLRQRALLLGIDIQLNDFNPVRPYTPGELEILHVPSVRPVIAGKLDPINGAYVLNILNRALQGCLSGDFSGMVTAPINKSIINDAGIPFTGHTEFLAEQTQTKQVVMMLVGGGMRVALATTHLPLRKVAEAITAPLLESVLRVLHNGLRWNFGIVNPRIHVAGLNPHAGEGGYLGREEIEIMIPVLDKLRREGLRVSTPLPADTLFTEHQLYECDAVLAMYHDQGLPALKHASFGEGVNVTLGLPVIRTSVDHGTALELAGTGKADAGSLFAAIKIAAEMVENRLSFQGGLFSDA